MREAVILLSYAFFPLSSFGYATCTFFSRISTWTRERINIDALRSKIKFPESETARGILPLSLAVKYSCKKAECKVNLYGDSKPRVSPRIADKQETGNR